MTSAAMEHTGRILVADDDDVVRQSTGELFRDEGYQVATVADAFEAAAALREAEFDLLVADIMMPGNSDLEFVKKLPALAPGMPILLMTGHPSLKTAIASVGQQVIGYLVKPVEFSEMLEMARPAIEYAQSYRALTSTKQRLTGWRTDLETVVARPGATMPMRSNTTVHAFMQLAQENLVGTVLDLVRVAQAVSGKASSAEICHLMNCPKLDAYYGAIAETIKVLHKTKNAFKSKELGELRVYLERVIADNS